MQSRQAVPPLMIPNMWILKAKRVHFRQNIVCMAETARDVSPVEKPTLSESWLPAGLRRIALVVRNKAPFPEDGASTVLEMEPGVTVVVGPNGSGKSNVVDAIAWVLGAQAPSSVRSQKMEDVIFSGTNKRAALGRAEVTLTLDNSAGLLPLDFSEVSVSRTLFRNGDSEYSINGVECRLLDVQELLSDAGVGRQQHVIISQGQIDAVLTARAEDRRAIIEEAAGILKYRKRKEKA
ncbi:MAG: chromosome segregation protein, partial [Actinomycetota bacterium]